MSTRFSHISYDKQSIESSQVFFEEFEKLETVIEGLENSRERAEAITCLENAHMWLGKAIKSDQLIRERRERDNL